MRHAPQTGNGGPEGSPCRPQTSQRRRARRAANAASASVIDAAVTADNFAMLFSKMADDERFETFADDYLHVGDAEATESEDELVAA